MFTLKTIGSGSSGNCYALVSEDEVLLLDLGLSELDIKRGINFNITNIVGCLVTHKHLDHAKSAEKFKKMCIPVFAPYESKTTEFKKRKFGNFTVYPLPMMDKQLKIWQHTDANGDECPCYGFLIIHPDIGTLLYITDTKLVRWRFAKSKVNHILIGTNYDDKKLTSNLNKRNHVLTGHLSLTQACEFVRVNATNSLRNVIMCHLSEENSDSDYFISEMQKVAKNANVSIAKAGMIVDVAEVPF